MLTFQFDPFPVLETRRLLLRQLTKEDAPEIFFLRSDSRVLTYLGKEPQEKAEEAENFIAQINQLIAANEGILWGITQKENPGLIIGTICFWNLQQDCHRAETGYVLHPELWGKGLMKEALAEVVNYGFNTLKLHSIEACLSPDNSASVALLETCGFVKEGLFKESFYFRGVYSDKLVYSRLCTG